MVIFEVQSSPDTERIGELSIFYENFTLGSSGRADLIFEDDLLKPFHLTFKQHAEGLLVVSVEDCFYNSNGKKIKGGKLHVQNDVIKIGETQILIKLLVFKNLSESFKTIYERRLSDEPDLESLVTQLQKELIHLENSKDV